MANEFLKAIHDYQKIIFRICRMYRNTREDREDLFQEIVFQLWKSYPSFKGQSKVSSWIYRVALNTSMATYRKQKVSIIFTEEFERDYVDHESMTSEHEELLFRAIRTLDDFDKAIISLFLEGFNYQEIADIAGISENNVGVRLNRIKNKLKELLN